MLLTNFRLFDGEDWHADARFTLRIEKGIIASIERGIARTEDAIDLDGRTVMPGLIDAHFHCNSPSLDVAKADRMLPSQMAQYARKYLEAALDAGFTTVRDAAGADVGLVRAIEEGLIDGPRLLVAGKALSQSGGHGDFAGGYSICDCGEYSGYLSKVVDGADAVRQTVREHLRDGAHHIKIFVSGGVLSPSDPIWMDQFTDEEIRAAVIEAERRRTYVMAHAVSGTSIRRCARLGVRSIEHGLQIDAETAEAVAASPSFVVPTLAVYHSLVRPELNLPTWAVEKAKRVVNDAVRSVEQCRAAGVPMGLGTDLLGMLHGSETQELLLRSEADGALSALRSATAINARILQLDGEIGRVAAGYGADLLLVAGDPISDIGLLTPERGGIAAIVRGGKVVRGTIASGAAGAETGQPVGMAETSCA
jgi:imidazolonepropionase-like amidohydrolase